MLRLADCLPYLASDRKSTARCVWLWCVGAAVVLAACSSGGGGDGGGGGAPPPATIEGSFIPTIATPPNNSVSLAQKTVQGDLITLNVMAKSLATSSSGAAFDVGFDPSAVNFIGFDAGTFYESNGTVNYQVALQGGSNNRLVVGITQQAGPGATGSGKLMELQFKVLAIGSSTLTFTNNNLTDPIGNLIPNVDWSGGTLTGS